MYHERFGFTSYKHYLCIVKPNIQKIMAVFIKLRQSRFKEENGGGKWFAQTVSRGEVHTDDIAKAIEENSTFKRGEVKGLIDELVETMTHELQMGKTVALDGFGRFRLVVESQGVSTPEEFSQKKHVKGIRCKFLPAGERDRLTHTLVSPLTKDTKINWVK